MKSIVIGLGIQGHKRAKFAGSDIVATVDPVNPNAQYKDFREVPLDQYDSAYVCTPDEVKFELLKELLSKKKHVLVEKPLLTTDNRQILELDEIARANQVTCYTAYNHRFEPHIVRMKETLDSGVLGKVYFARVFYGNGTARDVRNSAWRDQGTGVLPDIGSHLLDMALFLFNDLPGEFRPWSFDCFENRSYDHVLFGYKGEQVLEFEATLLSWRNTFGLDVYGEKGSAHIDCLCKWGPSTFVVRNRILPSGRPTESREVLECADPTWEAEYRYFKKLCQTGETNLKNDLWINTRLAGLGDRK